MATRLPNMATHSLEHLPNMATHSLEHLPNMATQATGCYNGVFAPARIYVKNLVVPPSYAFSPFSDRQARDLIRSDPIPCLIPSHV